MILFQAREQAGKHVICLILAGSTMTRSPSQTALTRARLARAQTIAAAGGFEDALSSGALPRFIDTTLSEVIVLGLLRQELATATRAEPYATIDKEVAGQKEPVIAKLLESATAETSTIAG